MRADFDLNEDGTTTPRHIKFRDGRGRPRGYNPEKAARIAAQIESGETEGLDENDANVLSVRKARASVSKVEADAANAWLKHKIDSGEYLSRTAFREAAATVLSEIAQALRSLPDALERRHGLAPDVVQAVETTIDDVLATAAASLGMFVQETIEVSEFAREVHV